MTLFTDPKKPIDQYIIEDNKNFTRTFDKAVMGFINGVDNIWNNPDGYTPQEMFDKVGGDGTEAALLLMRSEATKLWINTVDPEMLPVEYQGAPGEIQVNGDGTVTVL